MPPKKNKSKPRRRGRGRSTISSGVPKRVFGLTEYQRSLADPCNGPVKSPYGGEQGISQRFVLDTQFNNVAGHTSGFVLFTPAGNSYLFGSNASSNVGIAPSFAPGCGASFLGANSNKIRSISACVTVLASAVSYTNMTGEIGIAIVGSSQMSTLNTYSVDGLFQLTNERAVLAKEEYEIKWFPNTLDNTYAPTFNIGGGAGSASLTDPADNNAILILWRGYVAGAPLSFRLTNNVEWTPIANVGTAVTSIPAPPQNTAAQAAALHQHQSDWWHNLRKEFSGGALKLLGGLGKNALNQGVKYLSGTVGPAILAM